MRLHTNVVTEDDIRMAADAARADIDVLEETASRQGKDRAFTVHLSGESRRRQNHNGTTRDHNFAATWDQWGVFLSILFDMDPAMICGTKKYPWYSDRDDFTFKTGGRFRPGGIVTANTEGAILVNASEHDGTTGYVWRVAGSYWPPNAHGDHNFRYAGVPHQQQCTRCSAVKRRA